MFPFSSITICRTNAKFISNQPVFGKVSHMYMTTARFHSTINYSNTTWEHCNAVIANHTPMFILNIIAISQSRKPSLQSLESRSLFLPYPNTRISLTHRKRKWRLPFPLPLPCTQFPKNCTCSSLPRKLIPHTYMHSRQSGTSCGIEQTTWAPSDRFSSPHYPLLPCGTSLPKTPIPNITPW